MQLPEPIRLAATADLDQIPDKPAVFLLASREGAPYLAKTTMLRRRLRRLLGGSKWFSLRGVVERVEYWPTASNLASNLIHYALTRQHFPDTYLQRIKLRNPAMVRLTLANPFPRTQVTARLGSAASTFYGPFRTRANAEEFEKQMLDFFQIRRCQDDLAPSPDHPGCIYGEMGMCLRPCQEIVGVEEYATEVQRVSEFFATGGSSLRNAMERARDRASANLDFEEAARQHQRLDRLDQTLRLRDELVTSLSNLNGVAVCASVTPGAVELRFVREGCWLAERSFALEGAGISMDSRLRAIANELETPKLTVQQRQEHLALLSRWFYSSYREGEWIGFESLADLPFRKLVRAISRVASSAGAPVE
jgi:excinuclease UvrABC nuclease subunit